MDVVQHGTLLSGRQIVDHVYQFFEDGDHFPVVFGAALQIAAFPVFLDQIGDVSALLVQIARQCRFRTGTDALLIDDQVLLVADDEEGHVRHVSRFADLFSQRLDVLEGFDVGQIEDQDVGGGTPQTVVAVVGPLVVGIDGEVRNHRQVANLYFVESFVGDDGRVVGVFAVRLHVLFAEVVPHELLKQSSKLNKAHVVCDGLFISYQISFDVDVL